MATVVYPSELFPALAGVSVDIPEGWVPLPEAGQLLALALPVAAGDFRPNVIVAVRRMVKGTALESTKQELTARAASLTEYASIGTEDRLVDGHPGYRMEGSFIHPQAGTLVQAIRLAVADRGPVEDLVQITGSVSGSQALTLWPTIRAIQDSLRILV
ncbi:MAG: hypothetical protein LBV00_02645 [Propionibacteriaceae bacterium]|jgi:hypothetical protein|nr:hypothetical protein [Propionibacteriaceae bacterium]